MPDANRRECPRVVHTSVGIIHKRIGRWVDRTPYLCDIKDLSASGVCFESALSFDVDSCFFLTVLRYCGGKQINLYGEVVRKVEISPKKNRYGAKLYTDAYIPSAELLDNVEAIQRALAKREI